MTLLGRQVCRMVLICAAAATIPAAFASTIKGTVTDTLGARVAGATVRLETVGAAAKTVAEVKTGADGTFTLSAPTAGRFVLVVSAEGFDPARSDGFYLGGSETVNRGVTIAPARANTQVTVTATGLPTPLAQISSAVTVLGENELRNRESAVDPLRLVPGATMTQEGQRGGVAELFIRGGSSTANKVLVNGVRAVDVGGRFDYSTVAATDLDTIEIYRGADSVLYGTDAAAGVVSMNTRQGTTRMPTVTYAADGGNFGTLHGNVLVGGAAGRLDYFLGADLLNTGNSIPNNAFRDATEAANIGWALNSTTNVRFVGRYSDSSAGAPNAYGFYGIADPAKQTDQDLYLAGTFENQTTDRWHNLVRYGAARKREPYTQYGTNGIEDAYGDFLGLPVTIRGANGYSVTGQAILDYGGTAYPFTDLTVNNLDEIYYQSDYRFNAHTTGLFGFHFENERGVTALPYGTQSASRTNYDYTAQITGDLRNRLFYTVGGGFQKNQLFGTQADPRIALAYYLVRPGSGSFQGTKLVFDFAKGVQEPNLTSQTGSLYALLLSLPCDPPAPCGPQLIQQYNIGPVGALNSRSYDGGFEQTLLHQKAVLRARYFHNEFGNQVEYVYTQSLALLGVPQSVVSALIADSVYGAYVNSLDYRAHGAEAEVEFQPMRHLFVHVGYTYVDSVVQKSFSSDALSPTINPSFPTVAIGAYAPLVGARPFRLPPHTGFFQATYTAGKWFASFTGSVVSRADDSTFLSDQNYGYTLLLPNRNLDPSYQKLDLGGSYQMRPWMQIYTQIDNLLSQQRAGIIGFPALPFNFRSGIKVTLGGIHGE